MEHCLGLVIACVACLSAIRAATAGPIEDFQSQYPVAAAKLEEAYSHVTIETKRTRIIAPRAPGEPHRTWVEEINFYRDESNAVCTRKVLQSDDPEWPAGTIAYRGGNAALCFDAYKKPTDAEFLFTDYGRDPPFDQMARLQFSMLYAPFCLDGTQLTAIFPQQLKIAAVNSVIWDSTDSIEVVAQFQADGKTRTNHFYFQPGTYAFLGWKPDWADTGERIRYEPGTSPPRISHLEKWNAIEGERNRTGWTFDVTKLTFGPIAKDKFTMGGWGLKPPPLDLIGSSVPTIEDAANAKPTEVSAEAKSVLDKIASAYEKIHTAELRGHVTVTATQGDTQETAWDFTASFGGPGLFRHDAAKRFYVGCDGQTEYAYTYNMNGHQWANSYLSIPRAVAEVNRQMYPDLTLEVLDVQNPALGLLVEQDRRQEVCRGAKNIVKLPDAIVDGVSCEEIVAHAPDKAARRGWTRYFWVDANTGTLRKARFELIIPAQDGELAKNLAIDVTYGDAPVGEPITNEQFAWHAPANARDLSPAWAQLIGRPAPQVPLSLIDGTKVEWSSLKGHMVLLDFWATWCGPCRLAMPHLNDLYKTHKDAGLQAFAVDKEEKPELVKEYVKSSGLAVPVAMDNDSAIYQKYGGDGIPMTVIIGKDGIVMDVLVGYGESNTRRLDELVSQGMR